jgi:exonuclease SbcD
MPIILHFADAHIDMANYGRHDPETGLPMRVMDFLKSLDVIIDTAVDENVDLVIFAGDTYKDRNPAPTFQREWGARIMRLSRAGIPTLLLVGNHDLSPALGRAHALAEFATLEVPNVWVLDKPQFLGPDELAGLPLQIIALPWISRSGMMAHLDIRGGDPGLIYEQLEEKLTRLVDHWIDEADPGLPIVLTAHASVQGAKYGGERTVMLGEDLVLSGSLVRNPKLDYVALGHIHKPQNLTSDKKESPNDPPPVVYPGSIERVDFGEAGDEKFFVIANVARGKTEVEWRQLKGIRPFVDRVVRLESSEMIIDQLRDALPPEHELDNAVVRLAIDYPREWESMIDETAIREYTSGAFEFHLVKRPQMDARVRLPDGTLAGSMTPLELLETYWKANAVDTGDAAQLQSLAAGIIQGDGTEDVLGK